MAHEEKKALKYERINKQHILHKLNDISIWMEA